MESHAHLTRRAFETSVVQRYLFVVDGPVRAAVIGGSGFYAMEALSDVEELRIDTPFGSTSDNLVVGTLAGQRVAFLPRHGVGHRILPSEIPARANVHALKQLGVEFILSVSAVGSLREDIEPLHMVVPDQLIDRTRGRPSTFFGDGIVAHIAFADPFCPKLRAVLADATREAGGTVHNGGTLVVIEGPAFSTRAESNLYRIWGADIIGMTALPEAKLAREAEICYAILACSTDYDVWHDTHEDVSAEMIVANLLQNVELSRRAVALALERLPDVRNCPCSHALRDALITRPELAPEETTRRLAAILGRQVPQEAPGARP
jgi:5'-methylthioadenosine phosphorylase